jgi:hypothetical protein
MKKSILLIPLFLIGCATVKKTNTETELKTDSSSSVNIDATKFSEGFTLEPINLDKPILIGGKEHFNTRVIYNNSKETIKYRDTTQVKAVLKQEVKQKEKDYTEVIESLTTKLFWLLIIMFVIVMILNYLKRKATLL